MNRIAHVLKGQATTKYSKGLTLVELLVALILSSLVAIASTALFATSSAIYRTNDASQELQDKSRFAFEMIAQAIRHAGFQNYSQSKSFGFATREFQTVTYAPILGFSNSKIATTSNGDDNGQDNRGGFNSSDTIAVRFAGSSRISNSALPDGSVVDCQGVSQPTPIDANDTALSLFWVKNTGTADGEPELQCISRGNPTASGGAVRNSQVLISGVETFRIVYAVDTSGGSDANQWLTAKEVNDGSLWAGVRMIRIGIVVRGAPGSAQVSAQPNLLPLGADFPSVSFTPPQDTRLRKAFNFTITLRNPII